MSKPIKGYSTEFLETLAVFMRKEVNLEADVYAVSLSDKSACGS